MTKMTTIPENYNNIRAGIIELLKAAKSAAARNVNSIMTAVYWDIGRRIVETEQAGAVRANYGDELIKQLANDLSAQFGRGFGVVNLSQMRRFFLAWPEKGIFQTPSEKSLTPMLINDIWGNSSSIPALANHSHCLGPPMCGCSLSKSPEARTFYETETLRSAGLSGNWTVRSAVNFTNASPSQRTKPPCWRKQRTPNPAIW